MRHTLTIALFTLLLAATAASQSLLVGRVVDARTHNPLNKTRVTVLSTGQEALTNADGIFQVSLPKFLVPGTEVQIDVNAANLRIYLPRNGILIVRAPGGNPEEILLLPAGSKQFLYDPGATEALLAQASKPLLHQQPERKDTADREPRLQRFLKDWAGNYGFSLEDVQREVKFWGDQVRANREKASVRQQALAEFQAQHFAASSELFKESAHDVASELASIQAERAEANQKERTLLRQFLDDEIRAAESLAQSLTFSEAAKELASAAEHVPRERYAEWWAELQVRSSLALTAAGEFGEATNSAVSLRAAIAGYQNALQVYKKASLPQAWAMTQNLIGNASVILGERSNGVDGMEWLVASVTSYQNALQVRTRELLPQDWAMTQNNLGLAYQGLGERLSGDKGMAALRSSVTSYQNALQVYGKESLPYPWAGTQNNLGNSYMRLGQRLSGAARIGLLRSSVASYEKALQVRTKESSPQDWAGTQNNLGIAYQNLGEQLDGDEGMEALRASVASYQNALQIHTKESLPQYWAMTQNNLGLTYQDLGDRLSGDDGMLALRSSITSYQNALQVYRKELLPQAWATTQNNLGIVYQNLGERMSGPERMEALRASAASYENALQIRKKESLPEPWERTQNNLARLYFAQERWADAVEAEENVLTLYPNKEVTLAHAERIYHERLFRFDRAFELNARRVALGSGEDNFVENHLTTALFAECASRAALLLAKTPEKNARLRLTALRFACLSADSKSDENIRPAAQQLLTQITGLPKLNWTFSGTKHFISQNSAFAANATAWINLFESLEQGDESRARAALAALGVHE